MLTIAINALSALRGGSQTYLHHFLDNLPNDIDKVILITGKNHHVFEKYDSDKICVRFIDFASKNLLARSFWEVVSLDKFLEDYKVDIYYSPGGLMLTNFKNREFTTATALRNMLPLEKHERQRFPLFSFSRFKLWLLKYLFILSYKKSDKVIFISEYSRNVVKSYIPEIENKSVVIHHGLSDLFKKNLEPEGLGIDFLHKNKFYLYVSILDVYKAQKEVIKSFKNLYDNGFQYPLVLAGPKYNKYGDEVVELISEYGLSKSVFYLGQVEYEMLPQLYASSRALIFASSCECCPNILLEKLSAGKAVFCSNKNPMPEFGGDAPIYFDPYDISELSNKILNFEKDYYCLSEKLGAKSREQAQKFDWCKTVQSTINFLKK
ncbi:glycosyltransferase family 1 protein [Shewanella algae]|uniref:glycosyltransferase family 4 protein n=1 Tax=Shewanella algae TaxID=38313 RepID=UPI0031F59843